jgi:hypothetical protein
VFLRPLTTVPITTLKVYKTLLSRTFLPTVY